MRETKPLKKNRTVDVKISRAKADSDPELLSTPPNKS